MAKFTSNKSGPAPFWLETVIDVVSQDQVKNQSTISYKHYMKSGNSSYYPWYSDYDSRNTNYLKIEGVTRYSNQGPFQMTGTSKLLKSGTFTVNHNSSGEKSISIEAKYYRPKSMGTSLGGASMTINTTYQLPTIPRGIKDITMSKGSKVSDRFKFNFTKVSPSAKVKIEYSFSQEDGTFSKNYLLTSDYTEGTYLEISPTMINSMYNSNTKNKQYSVIYRASVSNGGVSVSSHRWTRNYTIDEVPVITNASFTLTGKNISLLPSNTALGGVHTVNITTTAKGVHGSTITAYQIRGMGQTSPNSTGRFSFKVPSNISGDGIVDIRAVDSRGNYSSWYNGVVSINVIKYSNPTFQKALAMRVDRNGELDPLGTYAKVEGAMSYTSAGGVNSISWTLKRGSTTVESGTSTSFSTVVSGVNLGGTEKFELSVTDKFSSTRSTTILLNKGSATLVLGEKVVGVNTVPTIEEGLQVEGRVDASTYMIRDGREKVRRLPQDYPLQATTTEFMRSSDMGLTETHTYATIVTVVPWTDKSGGVIHQTAYGQNSRIFHRVSDSTWSRWEEWKEITPTAPENASGKDIDTITTPGIYYSTGTGFRNPPSGNGQWAKLEVTTRTGTNTSNPTYQEYSGLDGEKYYRMHNSGKWYEWRNSTAPEAEARYVFLADVNWNGGDATVKFKKPFRSTPAVIVTGYGSDTTLAVRSRRTDGFDIRSSNGKGVGFSYIAMEQK